MHNVMLSRERERDRERERCTGTLCSGTGTAGTCTGTGTGTGIYRPSANGAIEIQRADARRFQRPQRRAHAAYIECDEEAKGRIWK